MKFAPEGDWMVGTPILAGFGDPVEAARRCDHPSWTEETRAIEQGTLIVMDGCDACIARRMRYRKATPEEQGKK